jgi:hypothetical protein
MATIMPGLLLALERVFQLRRSFCCGRWMPQARGVARVLVRQIEAGLRIRTAMTTVEKHLADDWIERAAVVRLVVEGRP